MCLAKTKLGKQCSFQAKKGSDYCGIHKNYKASPPPAPAGQEKETLCSATKRSGKRCNYKAKPGSTLCGVHGTKVDREEERVDLPPHTYACNVAGSSKDKANWKTRWEKFSGEAYPKTCRVKDCERKASCTGHLYLRDEEAKGASHPANYLVPICSHHNSVKYNAPNYFELKKTTVAVKINESL